MKIRRESHYRKNYVDDLPPLEDTATGQIITNDENKAFSPIADESFY